LTVAPLQGERIERKGNGPARYPGRCPRAVTFQPFGLDGIKDAAGADDACRIRIGDYRVASVIADKVLIVYIIRVGHRKEVYRGM
jgi:mRNA-degrading endonuclease RelE of RelBE toxin-antitoxin system